jgi:hypothetical protein
MKGSFRVRLGPIPYAVNFNQLADSVLCHLLYPSAKPDGLLPSAPPLSVLIPHARAVLAETHRPAVIITMSSGVHAPERLNHRQKRNSYALSIAELGLFISSKVIRPLLTKASWRQC